MLEAIEGSVVAEVAVGVWAFVELLHERVVCVGKVGCREEVESRL